jgi:acyl-CoA synthetase (AMP-forming)/AMP-acid ligase II
VPYAFACPDDVQAWRPSSLLAFARKRLPAHMVPRGAVAVPSFPRTASGKIDRAATMDIYYHRRGSP